MSKIVNKFMELDAIGGYDEITATDFSYYINEKVLEIVDAYISANDNDETVQMLYQLRDSIEELI